MSARKIQNILNKQINNRLSDMKLKIREESSKNLDTVYQKIPNRQTIENKFKVNSCSLKTQEKLTKIYNSLYKKLNNLEIKMHRGIEKTDNIKEKIRKIKDKYIPGIEKILQLIRVVINPALKAIIIAVEISLILPLTYSTGTIINKLIDRLAKAKSKEKENSGLLKGFIKAIPVYMKKAVELFSLIIKITVSYVMIYDLIKKLKLYLVFLYTNYIKKCNIPDSETPTNNEGEIQPTSLESAILNLIDNKTEGIEDMPNIVDKLTSLYNDLISDLYSQGKIQIVERLKNIEKQTNIKYKVIKVPLP